MYAAMRRKVNVLVEEALYYELLKRSGSMGMSCSMYLNTALYFRFRSGVLVYGVKVKRPYKRRCLYLSEGVHGFMKSRCQRLGCTYSEFINGFLMEPKKER